MIKADFLRLIGADQQPAEYLPVACLLQSGYGCAGFYNALLNQELAHTCVLVNARLVEFHTRHGDGAAIDSFAEFLEEIVLRAYHDESEPFADADSSTLYGRSIPLTAIDFDEITLLYPIAQIGALMRRAERAPDAVLPSFLDFNNKSEIIKLLRTRLW